MCLCGGGGGELKEGGERGKRVVGAEGRCRRTRRKEAKLLFGRCSC